jgi:hypothetical protein
MMLLKPWLSTLIPVMTPGEGVGATSDTRTHSGMRVVPGFW